MKRTRAVLIGDIVRRYLREEGLETPLNEYRLVHSWEEIPEIYTFAIKCCMYT